MTEPKYVLKGIDPQLPATYWRKRVRSVTWIIYTSVMGTNGAAALMYQLPYNVTWKDSIGKVIYISNLVLFVVLTSLLCTRFILYPPALKASFLHPMESSFISCFPLAVATLTSNAVYFGAASCGPWLIDAAIAFFFIYCTLSCCCAVFLPVIQWHKQSHPITSFLPAAILPSMGVVYSAPLAYAISAHTSSRTSLYLILIGHVISSVGVFTGLIHDSYFTMRMLNSGTIKPQLAPTMLIQVGPISWGAYGFIGLGMRAATSFPTAVPDYLHSAMAGAIFEIVGIYFGLMLWALSWWLILTSYVYILMCYWRGQWAWSNVHWALTFPVSGFVSTTILLGERFDSNFLKNMGAVQVVLWMISWLFALFVSMYGIWIGQIFVEGKDQNAPVGDYMGEFVECDDSSASRSDTRIDSSSSRESSSARSRKPQDTKRENGSVA